MVSMEKRAVVTSISMCARVCLKCFACRLNLPFMYRVAPLSMFAAGV